MIGIHRSPSSSRPLRNEVAPAHQVVGGGAEAIGCDVPSPSLYDLGRESLCESLGPVREQTLLSDSKSMRPVVKVEAVPTLADDAVIETHAMQPIDVVISNREAVGRQIPRRACNGVPGPSIAIHQDICRPVQTEDFYLAVRRNRKKPLPVRRIVHMARSLIQLKVQQQ